MEANNPERKKQKSLAIWFFIALLSALLLSQLAGEYIANIFIGLLGALMPILLGILFAYLLKKLTTILEEKVFHKLFQKSKKAKVYRRVLSTSIIFVVLLTIITFILMSVIPAVVNLITDLVNNSEAYVNKVTLELTQFFNNFELFNSVDLQTQITEIISTFATNIESYLPVLLEQALQIASDTTRIIFNILVAFILAFLMLKDKEKINEFFKRIVYANFKTYRADNMIKIARKSDTILYSYFIGKLIEAAIIFTLVGLGFYIIGVPYGFSLAAIIAILNFIPYVGAIIGIFPSLVLTIIFASVNTAIIAVIYSLVVIILITSFVSPVIFGRQMKVSALLVILSIIIGGGMFGIAGLLFAPPVVAILSVIIWESIKQKEERKLILKTHGLTEDDLLNDEVFIEAVQLTLEKKNKNKKA